MSYITSAAREQGTSTLHSSSGCVQETTLFKICELVKMQIKGSWESDINEDIVSVITRSLVTYLAGSGKVTKISGECSSRVTWSSEKRYQSTKRAGELRTKPL